MQKIGPKMQINLQNFYTLDGLLSQIAISIKSKTQFHWISIWPFKWAYVRQLLLFERRSLKMLKAPSQSIDIIGAKLKLAMTLGSSFSPCTFSQLSTDPNWHIFSKPGFFVKIFSSCFWQQCWQSWVWPTSRQHFLLILATFFMPIFC